MISIVLKEGDAEIAAVIKVVALALKLFSSRFNV